MPAMMSTVLEQAQIKSPADFGAVAADAIRLLDAATTEVGRDHRAALSFIAQANALLRVAANHVPAEWNHTRHDLARNHTAGGLAGWQYRRVKTFVENSLQDPIRIEDFCALTRLSASHFTRAFKVTTGETPHAYLTRARLDRACRLMLTSDRLLGDIALACGFGDQAHFSRAFRSHIGTTPAIWRRQNGGVVERVACVRASPIAPLEANTLQGQY